MSKKIILFIAILLLPSSVSFAKQGCCSYHGGVAYCGSSGYYICNDGTRSPSCTCGGGDEIELVDGPYGGNCECTISESNYYALKKENEELKKEKEQLQKEKQNINDSNSLSNWLALIFGVSTFFLVRDKLKSSY